MNTSISYEVTNGNQLLLVVSVFISVLVSFITGSISSERAFHQSIKGSTRVEWIESMRKVISEFYECIYLILYDNTADSKTLAKLRIMLRLYIFTVLRMLAKLMKLIVMII